jgi:hypothetical protein
MKIIEIDWNQRAGRRGKTALGAETPVSIFDFVERWKDEGYGIALMDAETDKVVQPYVDPSDFPDLQFVGARDGARSTDGKYYIRFHSGVLEEDPNALNKPPYVPGSMKDLVLAKPAHMILKAIKGLGEESIAGFSGVEEKDIPDIVEMCEPHELAEILRSVENQEQKLQAQPELALSSTKAGFDKTAAAPMTEEEGKALELSRSEVGQYNAFQDIANMIREHKSLTPEQRMERWMAIVDDDISHHGYFAIPRFWGDNDYRMALRKVSDGGYELFQIDFKSFDSEKPDVPKAKLNRTIEKFKGLKEASDWLTANRSKFVTEPGAVEKTAAVAGEKETKCPRCGTRYQKHPDRVGHEGIMQCPRCFLDYSPKAQTNLSAVWDNEQGKFVIGPKEKLFPNHEENQRKRKKFWESVS